MPTNATPDDKQRVSRREFLKTAAAVAGTGLVASCGPQPSPPSAPTSAPEATAVSTPTLVSAEPEEITLTFAADQDLATLQGDVWGALLGYQVYRNIYLTLAHYKVQEGADGYLYYMPGEYEWTGAESAEQSEDLTEVTWKIRQGLTFENGKQITAHEWKKTFDWFYDRQSVGWAQSNVNGLEHKDDVQVLDDYTLHMKFRFPSPWGIDGFTILNQGVQDVDEIMKHASESDPFGEKWLEQNCVASGPYRVESRVPGEQLVLKAREDWWAGKPAIDRFVLRPIPDASARYALLKRGEVDFANMIDWKDLPELETDPNLTVERFKTDEYFFMGIHHGMPPGDDKNVRKAIACAVDWDDVVDTIYYGYAERLKTPFGPFMEGQDPSTWPYEYDVDKAREYLAQSAYPQGCEIEMYIAEYIGAEEDMAVMIKDYLAEIGITLNINKQTGTENWDAKINKTLPCFFNEFYSWIPDAGYHLLWTALPESFSNPTDWKNEEAEPIMRQIIPLAPDDQERIRLLHDLQVIMAEDVFVYPLSAPELIVPHRANVRGMAYYPDSVFRFDTLWVE